MDTITWQDFTAVELRVGTILSVEDFPQARNPAYIITVDFGKELGIRKTSAQITALYGKDELLGRQIVGLSIKLLHLSLSCLPPVLDIGLLLVQSVEILLGLIQLGKQK